MVRAAAVMVAIVRLPRALRAGFWAAPSTKQTLRLREQRVDVQRIRPDAVNPFVAPAQSRSDRYAAPRGPRCLSPPGQHLPSRQTARPTGALPGCGRRGPVVSTGANRRLKSLTSSLVQPQGGSNEYNR